MNPRNPVNGANYLTLGILSLAVCPFLGPVAWSLCNNALSTLDRYEPRTGDVSQRGLVVAGRVCGMIGTAFFALGLCLFMLRSCAAGGPAQSSRNEPATTMTVDGQPLSSAGQKVIEGQMRASEAQYSGSQGPAHSRY